MCTDWNYKTFEQKYTFSFAIFRMLSSGTCRPRNLHARSSTISIQQYIANNADFLFILAKRPYLRLNISLLHNFLVIMTYLVITTYYFLITTFFPYNDFSSRDNHILSPFYDIFISLLDLLSCYYEYLSRYYDLLLCSMFSYALLTRSPCTVSDTQVTWRPVGLCFSLKSYGIVTLQVGYNSFLPCRFTDKRGVRLGSLI